MRSSRALALAAVLLSAVAGCATTTTVQTSSTAAPTRSAATDPDPFTVRADKLAAAWDGSPLQQTWQNGYVTQDDGVRVPSGAFRSQADKAAFETGKVRFAVRVPTGPAQQTVRFDRGTTRTLPGLQPQDALRVAGGGGPCPASSCTTTLTVTAVQPTTLRLPTSQGMATVPAWAFRIAGYQGEFVVAAVRPEPGPSASNPPQLNGYEGAGLIAVSSDGRTLTLGVGGGCGQGKPTGLVYETKDVVVVGATGAPTPIPSGTACAASATELPVQVHLSDVLDGRTVLDVADGMPELPVH
ncbi:hypothetical protein [Streptacidiphilus fuscans]|uniref:Lipoprotein n=1 Tax=Streptacidiphilus fuscans TaxID=2789292 RepID=A0A931B629_9ACTN|nr:hypothetical protein [Streptacidiphilus fuscans]MBF9070918.1 hypothetical protein [Streptacidiphilus fuscans]